MPFLTTKGALPVACEVGLSRSVRAFHIMPGLPGPEGQLHDHDYRIEIVVDREQLDGRGMVCDLDVLEAALTELTSRVEDRNLEEIRPSTRLVSSVSAASSTSRSQTMPRLSSCSRSTTISIR